MRQFFRFHVQDVKTFWRMVSQGAFVALGVCLLVGCQKSTTTFDALTPKSPPPPKLNLSAKAAVPVAPKVASVDPKSLLAGKTFASRADAFELMPEEKDYDELQAAERILAGSTWKVHVTPTLQMDEAPAPVIEPVPRWRLAGVVVGNGVIALLDTGSKVYDIRPGSVIPGSEWRVVAINSERALLERTSNKLPKQFEVGLQGPIGGGSGAARSGTTGGGAPGGGAPGGNTGAGGRAGGKGGVTLGG